MHASFRGVGEFHYVAPCPIAHAQLCPLPQIYELQLDLEIIENFGPVDRAAVRQ